jgi:CrcB protein
MNAALFVLVALAGGLGAASRFLLDGAIRARAGTALPLGTVLINCTGSLLLGLMVGLADRALLADTVRLVAGTGFLGGYTTFSAASVETIALIRGRRGVLAALNGLAVPVVTVLLASAGLALATLVP